MAMDLLMVQKQKAAQNRRPWHGTAFIIEALVILLCLAASSAILMQMFSIAFVRADDADRLSHAVILAANDAESFSANPSAETENLFYDLIDGQLVAVDSVNQDTYVVSRSTSEELTDAGRLYSAKIVVHQQGDILYELETASYVKGTGVRS